MTEEEQKIAEEMRVYNQKLKDGTLTKEERERMILLFDKEFTKMLELYPMSTEAEQSDS